MSTNSRIRILYDDGTSKSIYCHWDGYVEHNGIILQSYYFNKEKIEELISLGNISALNATPETCVAYHRDRNEPLEFWDSEQEFNYDFNCSLGAWFVTHSNCGYKHSNVLDLDDYFPITETNYLIDELLSIYDKHLSEDSNIISKEELIEIARNNVNVEGEN